MSHFKGLGLVATGRRSIRSGKEYDKYFDLGQVKGTNPIIADGDHYDTLRYMEKIARADVGQTRKISKVLKRDTLKATLNAIWSFLYNHVQYDQDSALREQLRSPVVVWKDRKSGVDCDCYSIFVSSVLHNLSIPHAFRMAAYDDDWQHVYVVVPKDGKSLSGGYFTVDPVVDRFDYEVPPSKKHDRFMQIQQLNGVPVTTIGTCLPNSRKYAWYERAAQFAERGEVITHDFLKANNIPFAEVDNSNGYGFHVVGTQVYQVAPIITRKQADNLLADIKAAESADQGQQPCPCKQAKNTRNLLAWIIGVSGAIVLLSGSGEKKNQAA